MAEGKNRQQDDSTLGKIFDFIFKEAEKPPEKRRPIKASGISGSDELVSALSAALEKPGVFLSDQIVKTFGDSLDAKFGSFKADETGATKIDFKLSTLKDIISDPNKTFDDIIQKAKDARKASWALFGGKAVQEMVALGWARRNNLDLDTARAIQGRFQLEHMDSALSKSEKEVEFRKARAISLAQGGRGAWMAGISPGGVTEFGSESGALILRGKELVGRKLLGYSYWEGLSNNEKEDFLKVLENNQSDISAFMRTRFPGYVLSEDFNEYVNELRDKVVKHGAWSMEKDRYLGLEIGNIADKITNLENYLSTNRTNLSPNELRNLETGIDRLKRAQIIIGGQTLDRSKLANARGIIRTQLSEYRNKLRQATTSDEKRFYRKEIADLRTNNGELNVLLAAGFVGQLEGYISSYKSLYGSNYLVSILNGSLFDPNQNSLFRPNDETKFFVARMDRHNNPLLDEDGKPIKDMIKFYTPVKGNKLVSSYNKVMTGIYYLTPRSIIRTLFFNGEGFMYLWNLAGDGTRAGAFYKKLANTFSFNARMKNRITTYVDQKILRRLRRSIAGAIGKSFTGEAAALLSKWAEGGGFQVLGQAIGRFIFQVFGVAISGGALNLVAGIIGGAITDVALKVGKVVMIFLLYSLLGIVAVFMLGAGATSKFNKQNFSYTNETPGEVLACENFKGTEEFIEDEDKWVGELQPFEAGSLPSGATCLLGTGGYSCTQGVFGSFSHKNVAAVDLVSPEYFHAPSFCGNGNCTVTSVGPVNCKSGYAGGRVIFTATYNGTTYTFKLIHVTYSQLSVGQTLSAGERVARIMTNEETTSACSTGMHIHLETQVNGKAVNPMDVLTSNTSSGGFGCNINTCP